MVILKGKKGTPNSSAQRGFSFLEIVISLLLISIGTLSMVHVIQVGLNANHRATQEIKAANLGMALITEILQKEFEDPAEPNDTPPDPEGGETRYDPAHISYYDDVDDYNNTIENPPRTITNIAMDGAGNWPNYQGFTRSVVVQFVEWNDPNWEVRDYFNAAFSKQITVTVSGPGIADVVFPPLIVDRP